MVKRIVDSKKKQLSGQNTRRFDQQICFLVSDEDTIPAAPQKSSPKHKNAKASMVDKENH